MNKAVLHVLLALLLCAGTMGKHNKVSKHLQKARELKAEKASAEKGDDDDTWVDAGEALIGEDVVGVCIDQGVDEDDIDPDEGAIDDAERDLESHVDDQYEILSDDDFSSLCP